MAIGVERAVSQFSGVAGEATTMHELGCELARELGRLVPHDGFMLSGLAPLTRVSCFLTGQHPYRRGAGQRASARGHGAAGVRRRACLPGFTDPDSLLPITYTHVTTMARCCPRSPPGPASRPEVAVLRRALEGCPRSRSPAVSACPPHGQRALQGALPQGRWLGPGGTPGHCRALRACRTGRTRPWTPTNACGPERPARSAVRWLWRSRASSSPIRRRRSRPVRGGSPGVRPSPGWRCSRRPPCRRPR